MTLALTALIGLAKSISWMRETLNFCDIANVDLALPMTVLNLILRCSGQHRDCFAFCPVVDMAESN